ncbi:Gfo/Idh/MocA family protein [Halosimplex amylolyticum]|uniref:Gfo/Idh/MocA family protein n=1 Tax=Halosimplex amylolyticum TaxID=3396616 RepID=UPI003F55F6EB
MARTVYFVGAGAIARSHVDSVRHLPDSDELEIAAADPSPEARAGFDDHVADARLYENSEEMLSESTDPDDIVVIAAPPFVHRDEAIRGLESGRHVLCEKPLAMDVSEAEEMLAAARANDCVLGSCSCRHYRTPGTEKVKSLVRDGEIGEPYHVTWVTRGQRGRPGIEYQPESKWFLDSSRSGGGIVMDWGPYEFATLDDLFDPEVVDVRHAWTAQPDTDVDPEDVPFDVETHGGATLVYQSDNDSVTVTYERASGTHGGARNVTEIEGTEGALRWSWTEVGESTVTLARDENGEVVEEQFTVNPVDELGPHERPLVYFDRVVRDGDAPIRTGPDALGSFAVICSIYDAAEFGEAQHVDLSNIGETASP